MYCNVCWNTDTKVLDSRVVDDGVTIKRRRECLVCGNRFNTFEKYEKINILIEKKYWKLEDYDEQKLFTSIQKAFNKRNVSIKIVENIKSNIETKLLNKRKITSNELWEYIMLELKKFDEVAYIRYASVFFDFKKREDFVEFIKKEFEN